MYYLPNDGAIAAFARLYARASESHLGGASFLPWNRVMLVMFEEALRRHDPSVSLPYWDVTIDQDMDNPVNSVLWTPEYFGAGTGEVMDGPAAGWVTSQGNLERNYGRQGRLISKEVIPNILQRCNLRDISQPFARRRNDLEYHHGGPHTWVGGDMAHPATAAFDPVFYMHHAFVDYIWEVFRRRQSRRCGVDPSQDYPEVPLGNSHAAESPMVGFEWFKNSDGLQNDWIDNWYNYESPPSCPNCCDGCSFPPPITCDRRRDVCVARSRRNFVFGPRSESTRIKDIIAQAQLDPREIETLTFQPTPRNRGQEFPAPPSDSRTLQTAIADAYESVRRSSEQGRSNDRSPSDTRDQRAQATSRDTTGAIDPRDRRAPSDPRDSGAPIESRDFRAPIDPRDSRAPIDPRDSRSHFDPRESRAPIDPRDSRAPIDPRDSSAPIDPRDSRSPIDPRDSRAPIDPRDSRAPIDPRDSRAPIDPRDSRSPIDPRDPRASFDIRGPRAPIDSRGPRASIDTRDPRASIAARDPRPLIDPRNPRAPMGPRDPRATIDPRDPRALIDTRDPRASFDPRDQRDLIGTRDPRAPIGSGDTRASIDSRDPIASIDSRDPRSSFVARDHRATIDPRDPRAPIDSRGPRANIDPRDSRVPIDPRDTRVPIDSRDLRGTMDTRDPRASIDSRDIRGPIDPRDPLGPVDQATDTMGIRSSSSRNTMNPVFDSRGSRLDSDSRVSVNHSPTLSSPSEVFFDPAPDRITDPIERLRDPRAFSTRNSHAERSASREHSEGLRDPTFNPRLEGPPVRLSPDAVRL
ncbi:AF4/FMR2 family member 1-like [Dreissena polymorpha]|uniref:AF4/FMR2 family member 1-like n=1 Tax=Dreissena polymorpha TaxID=45954 RepID=UPI00226512FE|nr:AF4/FMR2 family member 1-like [Dreissena polymorpha]